MMVTCHSNTLASSTKPALNPSMGFRASSARRNAASAAARGRGSPGKARRTPRRQRSRAARPPRRSSCARTRLSAACAAAGPPARSPSGRRLCGTHAWAPAAAWRCASRQFERRGAELVARRRAAAAAAPWVAGAAARHAAGRKEGGGVMHPASRNRKRTTGPACSVAWFLAACDAWTCPGQLLLLFPPFHPVQRAVSLPAPSLCASDASPPVGVRPGAQAHAGRHAGLLGRRVGVCAVCGGAGPRQRGAPPPYASAPDSSRARAGDHAHGS